MYVLAACIRLNVLATLQALEDASLSSYVFCPQAQLLVRGFLCTCFFLANPQAGFRVNHYGLYLDCL
jgi:hypothetical protein